MLDTRNGDAGQGESLLSTYARAVRSHWIVVVAIIALCVAAALFATSRIGPRYEARAELLVTPAPLYDPDLVGLDLIRDSGDEVRTMQTAASIVHSPRTARRAAEELGGSASVEQVLEDTKVDVEGESNVLAIDVSASTPEEAARVANTFAKAAVAERRDQLIRDVDVSVEGLQARLDSLRDAGDVRSAELLADRIATLQDIKASDRDPTLVLTSAAAVPTDEAGLPTIFAILIALILGAGIALAVALILEALSTRLRNESELDKLYPFPVLVRVPTVRQSGAQLVPWEMPADGMETFHTLAAQLQWRASRVESLDWGTASALTLCVTSPNTGDGKTTTTAALAVALSQAGHTVIAIDCDLRRPRLHAAFGLTPRNAIGDLLASNDRLEDHLVSVPNLPDVQVLTAQPGDAATIAELPLRLPHLLTQARERATVVLLDSPAIGEVGDALRFRDGIDNYLFVVRIGSTLRTGLQAARDILSSVNLLPIGIVVNGSSYTPSSRAHRQAEPVAPTDWDLPQVWAEHPSR
jgi:Mrp family chromosome partitioning ATPase/capsular polysaccharide biosynthesis protein